MSQHKSGSNLHRRVRDDDRDHDERPDCQMKEVDNGSKLDELVDLTNHEKRLHQGLENRSQ